MRILIASDLYAPSINGVATFIENLAAGLAAKGHTVAIAAPSTTRHSHRERHKGFIVYRIASLPLKLYPVRLSVLPGDELAAICRDFKPDVVHSQSVLMIGYGSIVEARRHTIPVVVTHHAVADNITENIKILLPVRQPFEQAMRLQSRLASSRAFAVTTPTQTAADILRLNVSKGKMRIISNGIDTRRFAPKSRKPLQLASKLGIPTDKPIVLYVGRVDSEKHLDTLVDAVHLANQTTPLHCVIAGKGNAVAALRQRAGELSVSDNYSFTGFIADSDLPGLYSLADVFAISSPAELQSIATLEAMASGLPIAAAKAGALPELCSNGENGLLFETDNATSLAAALTTLAADPALRQRMGAASRKAALGHALDKTINQFESLYAEVCAAAPAHRT